MTAGITCCDRKSGVGFFREAHLVLNCFACVIENTAATVYNEGKFGINGLAIVSGQLLNRFLKRFFIACEGNDQIAIRYKPVFFQPNKKCGQY